MNNLKLNKLIVSILLSILLLGCSPPARYKELTKGRIARVEYLQGSWSSKEKTFIYFEDESIFYLFGHRDIPSKNIIILKLESGTGSMEDLDYKIIKNSD